MRNSTGMRNASTEHLKYMASNFGIMPYPQNVSRKIGKTMVDLLGVEYGTVDNVLLIKVQGVAQYNHVFNATRVMEAKVHNKGGFRCAVHFNGDIFVSVRSSDVADDLEDTKESFGMVDVVFRRIHRLLCFEDADLDPCTSRPIVSKLSIGMLKNKRKCRFSI